MQSAAVNPLGVYDTSTALWLQGKGQPVHAEQDKLDIKSEPSAAFLTGRTEEFNRQLREQPTDAQLWIKFIKFQVKRPLAKKPVALAFEGSVNIKKSAFSPDLCFYQLSTGGYAM